MSHQYHPFWFPECLLCGMGNLPAVVCLLNSCHEEHGLSTIVDEQTLETEAAGHFWKGCQFCQRQMLADAAAWESTALCADCWNLYVIAERLPPTTARQVAAEVQAGKLEFGWDPFSQTLVRVRR